MVNILLRDTCDNIDLYVILTEYIEFYKMRFNKPPAITKKLPEKQITNSLPKLPTSK